MPKGVASRLYPVVVSPAFLDKEVGGLISEPPFPPFPCSCNGMAGYAARIISIFLFCFRTAYFIPLKNRHENRRTPAFTGPRNPDCRNPFHWPCRMRLFYARIRTGG